MSLQLCLHDSAYVLFVWQPHTLRSKAFADMKGYYNDITHNNLDLIKSLKDDVAVMKRKEAANEKLMYEIAQENKRLAEPLSRALKVRAGLLALGFLLHCTKPQVVS